MNTAPPDYHREFNLTRPLANEFLAMSHSQLWKDMQILSNLLDVLGDHVSPDTGEPPDLSYLDWYLDRVAAAWERRRERYERRVDDRFLPVWPDTTDYERMPAPADDLKTHIPVEQYLAEQLPGIELRAVGNRIRSLCPYPDHHEETPSFTIFEDSHAWCFGCNRGGDLFRIIGLVEGLPRFRDQLERAASFAPVALRSSIVPENASFPGNPHREMGRKERSGIGGFAPIRVVNGQVAS